MVIKESRTGRSWRAAAEAVGFTCEDPPKKVCRYAGERQYQLDYPKITTDPLVNKIHIMSYSVTLPDHDNPNDIDVRGMTFVVP